jgi:hypothetical protein
MRWGGRRFCDGFSRYFDDPPPYDPNDPAPF